MAQFIGQLQSLSTYSLLSQHLKLRDRAEDECVSDNSSVERKFFKFSLLYLFLHFGAIIVETKTNIAWPGF